MSRNETQQVKLTPVQAEVMKWLNGGWTAHVHSGAAVHINGKRVCNLDTMAALIRRGLVVRVSRWEFRAAPPAELTTNQRTAVER